MMRLKPFNFSIQKSNVSCESCHGPGRKHIELARSGKGFKNMPNFALVDINSTNVAQIESCAKCHARRGFVYPGHHAGNFLDHFLPEVVQPWSPDTCAYLPCRWALMMKLMFIAPISRASRSTRESNAQIVMTLTQ